MSEVLPRLLLTGSRDWADDTVLRSVLLEELSALGGHAVLVHGGCRTGVDVLGDRFWRELGLPVEVWAADWGKHGRAAGPIRNQAMVASGVDRCVAFPMGVSRGTRGCAVIAGAAGVPVRVVEG